MEKENRERKPLISKYAVDVSSFESVAFDELNLMNRSRLIVIDEIGVYFIICDYVKMIAVY